MDSVSPARMMAILFSAARPATLKRWRFMVLLAGIALSGAAAAQEAIEEVYGAESGEIVLVPTGDAVLSGLPDRTEKGGQYLQVTADDGGVQWSPPPPENLPPFVGKEGLYLQVNKTATAALWSALPPAVLPSLTGQSGNVLQVIGPTDQPRLFWNTTLNIVRGGLPPISGKANQYLQVGNTGASLQWAPGAELPAFAGAGRFLITNAANNATAWQTPTAAVLSGLPSLEADEILVTNSGANGLEWNTPSKVVLSALPSLTSQAGKVLTVNTAENGLQWTAKGGGGGSVPPYETNKPAAPVINGLTGSRNTISRGDHAHPPDAQIAINKAQAASNANSIGSNKTTIDTLRVEVAAIRQPPAFSGNGGKVVRLKTDASALEYVEEHALVTEGLPAITGNSGKVLKVNGTATGVEWATAGGGGSSGGSCDWDVVLDFTTTPTHDAVTAFWTKMQGASRYEELAVFLEGSTGLNRRYSVLIPMRAAWPAFATSGNTSVSIRVEGAASVSGNANSVQLNLDSLFQSGAVTNRATIRVINQDRGPPVVAGRTCGGGGGGNTPEIPSPTPAGSLKHLRVNQAGAAYELADPPVGLPSFAGAGRALITNTQNNGAAWTPVASLVETGLPTRTGHGGQYLALNANATAIDWAAPLPDLEDNAGKSLYVNAAEDGTEWDDPRAPAFAAGWVKLFEGNTDGVAGTASISFTITDDSTTAEGFLEAQRDTAGMGPYRQFLFQVAWNIGTGSDESLIQTQAILPGVPLGGSVAQANQPISYLGNLPGLQANCAISLTASRSEVTLTGQGGCQPDWGNRGNQNVNLFWKLWGMR